MYRRGDYIKILPEFQDEGDDSFCWVCITDEEKGMVDVSPEGTALHFPPIYSMRVEWIVPDRARSG